MPNRIIKESICFSESINKLSYFEECVFYRLIVNCDDYGRFDGRPAIIKARLFPLRDNVTAKSVADAIHKLSIIGLVAPYEICGKPYLYLTGWNDSQQIRSKRSKYPDPEGHESVISDDINGYQMISDDIRCYRNPNPNPNPNPKDNMCAGSARKSDYPDGFESLWKAYPNHSSGKKEAYKAYQKAIKLVSLEDMLKAIEKQNGSEQWHEDNGKYIPMLTTWLNKGRWDAELPDRKRRAGYEQHEKPIDISDITLEL